MKTRGFDEPLYILPFDHRGSFQTKLFGWKGTLCPAQTADIAAATKRLRSKNKRKIEKGISHATGNDRTGSDGWE